MKLYEMEPPVRTILLGHVLLVFCCIFYLAWWCAAFRPERHGTTLLSGISLGIAAVCGIVGAVCSVRGLGAVQKVRPCIGGGRFLLAGACAYLLLLAVTRFALKRQVTTELLLIVGWAVLELAVLAAVYGGGVIGFRDSLFWSIVTVAVAVFSLICYLLYYGLSDRAGYVDGMIPLILVGLAEACIGLSVCLAGRGS